MKLLALAAAVLALPISGWVGTLSTGAHASVRYQVLRLPLLNTETGRVEMRPVSVPLANSQALTATGSPTATTPTPGTATPATGTATPTPGTPTATPTSTPNYPDPITILQNFATVYGAIQTAHIELLSSAEKPNVEKLTIDGVGDATCKGPSMQLKVKASDVLEGTNQSHKATATFIRVRNKTEVKNSGKNAKWQQVKQPENVTIYSFPYPIDNPLVCPTATAPGGSGSGNPGFTDVTKDVVNLGPDTFQGNAVWHIHFVDVRTDNQGNSANLDEDFYIGQAHFLPYVLTQTYNDTTDGLVYINKQVTTKIGEKVKISYHKIGTK